MKLSKKDIQVINSKRSARPGKIYSDFNGTKYIGQKDGSLTEYKKATKDILKDRKTEGRIFTNEKDIEALEEEDVELRALIKKTECKLIAMNIVLG